MADEISLANVVRIERDGPVWRASIGPPGQGMWAQGGTPASALVWLAGRCEAYRWPFDETWVDRLEK